MPDLWNFNFAAPGPIHFGWGRRHETGEVARSLGGRALILCGSRTLAAHEMFREITASLAAAGVSSLHLLTICREPLVEDVDHAVARLRDCHAGPGDLLLALGGGAALDLAKAAAAMYTQPDSQDVRDYLEGVGRGLALTRDPLPVLAMPTTGGTGSEATRNGVISSLAPPYKKSLRSAKLLPRAVIADPELAVLVPPQQTAHAGLDAITQLIESFISRRAQPLTDGLCLSALPTAIKALPRAYQTGSDRAARVAMAYAALTSGLALANSGLGVAHAVAAALGVQAGVPHGLACAVMLPVALEINRPACEDRLAELGEAITEQSFATQSAAADALLEEVAGLCGRLGIPRRLSALGVRREQLPALVAGSQGNSLNGNPRDLSDDELYGLLERMF